MIPVAVNGNGVTTSPWTPSPAIISKYGNVRINGMAIVVHGDVIPTHTRHNHPTHTAPTMISSQGRVRAWGQNIIIDGDAATCGHRVVASSGSVRFRP